MKRNIKKGDLVMILKGKDRKKTGRVIKFVDKGQKVIIEGLNLVKKFKKPKREGEKGEIITIPRPISYSNIALVCPHCQKPTRIGILIKEESKYRICKKCNKIISEIK